MGEDDCELIVRLATRAGMIMEDASVTALTLAGKNAEALDAALGELEDAATAITALVAAARAIMVIG